MAKLLRRFRLLTLAALLLGTCARAANHVVLYSPCTVSGVLSPDTVAVVPGDNITWTFDGSCISGRTGLDPYFEYRVIVAYNGGTQAGGPFNTGVWEGPGFWCDPHGPNGELCGLINYSFPTSPDVVAGAAPGDYPYLVLVYNQGFPNVAGGAVIKVLAQPTPTLRRSWGQLKRAYR